MKARLTAGACVAALAVATGCAGGSTSVPEPEPWATEFVQEQIVCDVREATFLAFDAREVTVSHDGSVLARGSLDGRSLSDACRATPAADGGDRAPDPRRWSGPLYGSMELSCRVDDRIAIQTHPIMERNAPSGTTLALLRPGRFELVASVVLKPGGLADLLRLVALRPDVLTRS